MATVDGITAAKAAQIEGKTVENAYVDVSGYLHIVLQDTTDINVGQVSDVAALPNHEADVSTHGVTDEIVGLGKVQTLSNKTLIAPVIASFLNAAHQHGDAAGGGPVNLDYFYFSNSFTDRTLTEASPGPKVLSSITPGEGLWLVLATHRGWTTNGQQTLVRISLSTADGTLSAAGGKDMESQSAGNSGGSLTAAFWANPSPSGLISLVMERTGGVSGGEVTGTGTVGSWACLRIGDYDTFV